MRSREGMQWLATAALLVVAGQVAAQEPSPQRPELLQARYQIAVMEAALEQAVRLGASQMNVQLQAVGPDMVFLTGSPRARGFRLDDYGVFFHVDVPVMRRSLAWSFRALRQHDGLVLAALQDFRRKVEAIGDPSVRQQLEPAVRQIEQAAMPVPAAATGGEGPRQGRVLSAEGTTRRGQAPLDDPSEAYTESVKAALIGAMLVYSKQLSLQPSDWLTIAARDQEGSRLEAGDPYGVSTMVLRVRGSDLEAFHSERISEAEARARVQSAEK